MMPASVRELEEHSVICPSQSGSDRNGVVKFMLLTRGSPNVFEQLLRKPATDPCLARSSIGVIEADMPFAMVALASWR